MEQVAERARPRPSVLIADDDAALRAVVRVALATQGWSVLESKTPDDTVEAVKRLRPEIVLLDVVFEGHTRDGFSVCRELKSAQATNKIPVVMLTAHDNAENRAFSSAMGATAYIAKPFGALDLVRMVRLVHEQGRSDPGLGLYLIDAGAIRPAQLERALAEQRLRSGDKVPIGEILMELGFAGQEDVRRALARQQMAREVLSAPRPSRALRVVIADDHASVREGLQAAISADESFNVVGVAADGEEALRLAREQRPDLVVLDNEMPKRSGLDVLRVVHDELPAVDVVMFTLDDRIRDAALRAGAVAVVTKDLPLQVLIATLRRTGASRVPEAPTSSGVLLAVRTVSRVAWGVVARLKRMFTVMGVLLVGYAGAFLVAEPFLGASAAVMAVVPVALAGALLGVESGVVVAVLAGIATALLWQGTGHAVGEPVLSVRGNGLGFLALMGLGAGFGGMRVLRGRIDPGARRAGALAEAALTLASGPGPDTLALLAQAALEVVPGDAALLYAAIPGGGLELVARSRGARTPLGRREVPGAVAEAHATGGVTVVSDPRPIAIAVGIPRVHSAIVAPLAIPGERSAGVILVLSTRRGAYGEMHVATLATYAEFVGMAIMTRPHPSAPLIPQIGALTTNATDALNG